MNNLLTEYQIGKIFNINPLTLKKLLRDKKLPCVYEDSKRPLFRIEAISEWMAHNPLVEEDEDARLVKLQAEWREQSPEVFTALRAMDTKVIAHSNAQKYPKRYNLIKRPSKHYGFLYYVRYIDKGKPVPSKWNTHTNILQEAEQFAQDNRSRILAEYYAKHTPEDALYPVLEGYYKAGSSYLEKDKNRNRVLGKRTTSVYYHFMKDKFVSYLREKNVRNFGEINPPLIANFQDHLLSAGMKPQSINRCLSSVNCVFNHLLITGVIKENPFNRVASLKVGAESAEVRGCYDLDKLKGVFTTPWDDTLSYLLCLVIYATGMRNSEIEKIQVNDLIELDGIHFVDIKESKTRNGIRLVPLHDFVYRQIEQYAQQTGKNGEDYLFSAHGGPNQSKLYKGANILLGEKLKTSGEDIAKELEKQKISFYSGRHFWKTLMNSEGLGEDIEEFFMGHKVSGDVAKNYNHKDKQGRQKLLQKAQEVFTVLDKKLFAER